MIQRLYKRPKARMAHGKKYKLSPRQRDLLYHLLVNGPVELVALLADGKLLKTVDVLINHGMVDKINGHLMLTDKGGAFASVDRISGLDS